ncbi:hypothetical protein LC653_28815 [Nostoc sp. CHAB 5784]|nr:hypothetical protein [Nostoc mirabile CHAB5784]
MSEITKTVSTSETISETYQQEVIVVEIPMAATSEDKYINTKSANLNYVSPPLLHKAYCADKESL